MPRDARPPLDDVSVVTETVPLTPAIAARLTTYVDLLHQWQRAKNLVGPGTLDEVWRRHVLDSTGALAALPTARRWVDLGSGAGFPGMVTAILLSETAGAQVDLVESNARKVAFLKTVARTTAAPARAHAARIEDVVAGLAADRTAPVEAVSARALAPLDRLLALAAPLMLAGAAGIFHKGRDLAREVEEARAHWRFDLVEHPSRSDPEGRIVVVRDLAPLERG
ncbi:16S rRNA (guanine(527)-N(7))-methyltransferase RsmG [Segnochrobactrum spirostomi]|uniref:Ribosomal RNA small subunit methyltransferase G n=1 Tax=Segnochrobactrum spirostomi TaxID=2608987 RepID=A0A6A7Y1J9_9HYPH|nr:16S rRNA (guanine(527)-N(7))-methyltransferase RsmG [Segnochrobactrum spirostomi]MQT12874.1 16S rRNA (guanine(527)-N(7))-methyltransferase RsmG [Segnochrobactrum spirostomi]